MTHQSLPGTRVAIVAREQTWDKCKLMVATKSAASTKATSIKEDILQDWLDAHHKREMLASGPKNMRSKARCVGGDSEDPDEGVSRLAL